MKIIANLAPFEPFFFKCGYFCENMFVFYFATKYLQFLSFDTHFVDHKRFKNMIYFEIISILCKTNFQNSRILQNVIKEFSLSAFSRLIFFPTIQIRFFEVKFSKDFGYSNISFKTYRENIALVETYIAV